MQSSPLRFGASAYWLLGISVLASCHAADHWAYRQPVRPVSPGRLEGRIEL